MEYDVSKTILVVEDSPTDLALLEAALRDHGYTIVSVADGEEAIITATAAPPSLVLLDVVLPKMNGFQVCRKLKTSPATESVPVVLVTSKAQESDRFWGLKQGADAYLTKPYDASELRETVARLI